MVGLRFIDNRFGRIDFFMTQPHMTRLFQQMGSFNLIDSHGLFNPLNGLSGLWTGYTVYVNGYVNPNMTWHIPSITDYMGHVV